MIECEIRESFGRGNFGLLGRSFIAWFGVGGFVFRIDLYYCGSFLDLNHLYSWFRVPQPTDWYAYQNL